MCWTTIGPESTQVASGSKRKASDATPGLKRRKKRKHSNEFIDSNNGRRNKPGTSPPANHDHGRTGDLVLAELSDSPEAIQVVRQSTCILRELKYPQVCDSCVKRGSECKWPSQNEGSGCQSSKRAACTACVDHKTRCHIAGESTDTYYFSPFSTITLGVFSIRRPRGKGAGKCPPDVQARMDQMELRLNLVTEQIAELLKATKSLDSGDLELQSQVNNTEGHRDKLKKRAP